MSAISRSIYVKAAWSLLAQIGQMAPLPVVFILASRADRVDIAASLVWSMTVSTPLFVLSGLLLRQVYVVDSQRAERDELEPYLVHRFGSTAAALVGSVSVLVFVVTDVVTAVTFCSFRATDSLLDLALAPANRRSQFSVIAAVQSTRMLASLVAAGVVAATDSSPLWVLHVAGASGMALAAGLLRGTVSRARLARVRRRELAAISRRALPLGLVAFLAGLDASVPRAVVGTRYGDVELAQFGAAGILLTALASFGTAVNQSLLPSLARMTALGHEAVAVVHRLTMRTAPLVVAAPLAAMILPSSVWSTTFGSAAPSRSLVAAAVFAGACRVVGDPWRTLLRAAGAFGPQFRIELIGTVASALSVLLLLHLVGLPGGFLAVAVGALAAIELSRRRCSA